MSSRKKSQQAPTLSQPFKFADADLLMENAEALISAEEAGRYTNSADTVKWKNSTYVPAYSLGNIAGHILGEFVAKRVAPTNLGLNTGETPVPYWIADRVRTAENAQVFMDLWNNGHKFHVLYQRLIGGITSPVRLQTEWGEQFGQIFDYFIRGTIETRPVLSPYIGQKRGAAGLVRRFYHGEGSESATIESKTVKTGEFAKCAYTAVRYGLFYTAKVSINERARQFAQTWINNAIEREHMIVPLAVLVLKRADAPLVKAHWINNEPMEASMFELWVDKSLDAEDSPHPIRTQYVRSIRNPLAKQGIKVVVKDDLRKECFAYMEVPKFKTIKEEKAFVESKVEEILNEERRRYGVVRTPAPVETPIAVAAEFPF